MPAAATRSVKSVKVMADGDGERLLRKRIPPLPLDFAGKRNTSQRLEGGTIPVAAGLLPRLRDVSPPAAPRYYDFAAGSAGATGGGSGTVAAGSAGDAEKSCS